MIGMAIPGPSDQMDCVDGSTCKVVKGTHAWGVDVVQDVDMSAAASVTITGAQDDGVRSGKR